MPFFIIKRVLVICDDCGTSAELDCFAVKDARRFGWSISKDYRKCYCPKCATLHVGRPSKVKKLYQYSIS